MVSTCHDYQISGQELFPRLERSRESIMLGEHYEGEEEEYPRVRFDRIEHHLAMLTSMVSYLLATKIKEIPSKNTCHEVPKKKEDKIETKRKTKVDMGE